MKKTRQLPSKCINMFIHQALNWTSLFLVCLGDKYRAKAKHTKMEN